MSKPYMKVTSDFTEEFNKVVQGFKNDEVLVGIPETDATRQVLDDEGKATKPINNATILAMNEFGSPAANIPARPAMKTGIKNAQDQIAEEFKKAAKAALEKGLSALAQYYERAGIIAANSIKKVINSQEGFTPLSEATLRAREGKGFKGTKALIVTGQLRNAITSVVRRKI